MTPPKRPGLPGEIDARTVLGFHPRDGRPVACCIVHPVADEAAAGSRLDRFAAALGLVDTAADHLTQVPGDRAGVTADGGRATLWTGDGQALVAEHDDDWAEAVVDRGWVVVIVGRDSTLAHASRAEVMEHLSDGADVHVGLLRAH